VRKNTSCMNAHTWDLKENARELENVLRGEVILNGGGESGKCTAKGRGPPTARHYKGQGAG